MSEETRGSFSGKLGFIMATASSAIGLGTIWRFPYLVEENGGGLFLIVYIILSLTMGLCLMIMEVAYGRHVQKSGANAFGAYGKKYRPIGWLLTIIPLVIVSFYVVVGGWITIYMFKYCIGDISALTSSGYFQSFISLSTGGVFDNAFTGFIIFTVLTVAVIMAGVQKGIEKLSNILIPVLLLMIIGLCVYILTLPGIMGGVAYYFTPNTEAFSQGFLTDAIGQVFFSLSLSCGILIAYGSYMKKDGEIERSLSWSLIIAVLVAVLVGLMIIPCVKLYNLDPSYGPGLLFESMAVIFSDIPGGTVVGAFFYILVFFAALTSSISLFEACVSSFVDNLGWTRRRSISVIAVLTVALGMLCCLGYGPLSGMSFDLASVHYTVLDMFDTLTSVFLLPIAGILTCLFIGYVVKTKVISEEVRSSGPFVTERLFHVMVRYIAPVLIGIVLIVGVTALFSA